MKIVDTFAFLLGTWRVTRWIEDHQAGTKGRFGGNATLIELQSDHSAAHATRARYDEAGELHFGNHIGHAQRSLDYVRLDDATLMRYFTDGRPFLALDLTNGVWRGTHFCGDDRYDIATFVRSRDVVQERWRIAGPAKDYDGITALARIG